MVSYSLKCFVSVAAKISESVTIWIPKYKKIPQNYRSNAKFSRLLGGNAPGRGTYTTPATWAAPGPLPHFGPPPPLPQADLIGPALHIAAHLNAEIILVVTV